MLKRKTIKINVFRYIAINKGIIFKYRLLIRTTENLHETLREEGL